MDANYDTVFVGAGHNALVAAAYLARAGRRVLVLDRNEAAGGFVQSAELAPGIIYDRFASVVPLLAAGPAYAELGEELAAHGLELLNTPFPTGVSLEDGTTAVLPRDPAQLVAEAERLHAGDGSRVEALRDALEADLDTVMGLLTQDLQAPPARAAVAQLLARETGWSPLATLALETPRATVSELRAPALRSMLGCWPLHICGKGPDDAGGGLWVPLALVAFLVAGMPLPRGGIGWLTEALIALIRAHGGQVVTGSTVRRIMVERGVATGVVTEEGAAWRADRAVVASVTPDQLYDVLLADADVPAEVAAQARRYRYGSSAVQIHLALGTPPRWPDPRFRGIGQPFLTDSLDGTSLHVAQARAGLLPAHPTMTIDCPTDRDPTRAPAGAAVVRIQVTDVPFRPRGDAAGTIDVGDGQWTEALTERFVARTLALAERHVPGLTASIRHQAVVTPQTIADFNPNSGPGDLYAGSTPLTQNLVLRPLAVAPGTRTFVPNLHLLGAATWPGSGVNGASGYVVARQLLEESGP